jgi:hypothetical protein
VKSGIALGSVLLFALLPAVLVACGDDEPSAEEAQSNLCDDLDGLRSSLASLSDLSIDSSISDFEDARAEVGDAVEEVVDSAGEVAEANADELQSASDDLRDAVDDIDEDTSLRDAATELQDEFSTVVAEQDELRSDVNCDAGGAGGGE